MKNASTLSASKTDTPKTPGGISRSLLTPCRRLGLSRKFRKSGPSPFQSPLSTGTEDKQKKVETRKRKESLEESPQTPESVDDCGTSSELVQTPIRNVELPRRKKSKTLLSSIYKGTEEEEQDKNCQPVVDKNIKYDNVHNNSTSHSGQTHSKTEKVSSPLRLKSKSRSKNIFPSNSISKETPTISEKENLSNNTKSLEINNTDKTEINCSTQDKIKEKSPNNLTKECIVVIQRKIYKNELKVKSETKDSKDSRPNDDISKPKDTVSQGLFDSETDDIPLNCLNKEIADKPAPKITETDDDFVTNKLIKKHGTTKCTIKPHTSAKNNKPLVVNLEVSKIPVSQSSADDDDDFFETKRTILVKKSYDKVIRPQKAKSTGSITQKDIDDLKSRIETKKKLLLAKAMTEDTKELRDLIKKWQKGCQDAIMELMDLMKVKFPDKQNMDYSEILKTLKIPASLIGYDSDDDCFLTPNDQSIILANVKD